MLNQFIKENIDSTRTDYDCISWIILCTFYQIWRGYERVQNIDCAALGAIYIQ